jgi:hypothetical protein
MKTVSEWFKEYFTPSQYVDAIFHAIGQCVEDNEEPTLLDALSSIDAQAAIEHKVDTHVPIIDWEAEIKRNEFYHKYIQ